MKPIKTDRPQRKQIKVLIVDDSAFMRNTISGMISSDPEITVIGTARDGMEAVEKAASLKPDVITLDVEMPRMGGLDALKIIMSQNPVPVLMVSSLTTEGAHETLEALDMGAVDFIPKNLSNLSVNIVNIQETLVEKIKTASKCRILNNGKSRTASPNIVLPSYDFSAHRRAHVVAIGSSTGGPKALQQILAALPRDFPVPILVSQHMPPNFTGPLAKRLNQLSQINVKEAEDGETISRGTAFIAPGVGHMKILKKKMTETVISIESHNGQYIYKPSVDALMISVAHVYSGHVVGVILTGLGNDGEKGMKEIKNKGGRTIAQNENSCVVYGMPRAVIEAGMADKVVSVEEIAGEIINTV
jgi:two-component system chemotaxis response regulator CheB